MSLLRLEGQIGTSLHTLSAGTALSIYAGGSPVQNDPPQEQQQAIAIKMIGANPLYISTDSASLSSSNYMWKVLATDTQALFLSFTEKAPLFVLGTNADTYRIWRIR